MVVGGVLSRVDSRSVHCIGEPVQELCGCVPLPDAALPRPRVQPQSGSLVVDEAGDDLDPVLDRIERGARVTIPVTSRCASMRPMASLLSGWSHVPDRKPYHLGLGPWAVRNIWQVPGCIAASCGIGSPGRRRAAAATGLIAEVVGRAPGWNSQPVGLTIQLRGDAVRLEATGPVTPTIEATAYYDVVPDDPLPDGC